MIFVEVKVPFTINSNHYKPLLLANREAQISKNKPQKLQFIVT